MDYGLRHYETSQRLWWFSALLICLAFAYPASGQYLVTASQATAPALDNLKVEAFKNPGFWRQIHWVTESPMGRPIVFLVLGACYYWGIHLAWLVVQWVGRWLLGRDLRAVTENEKETSETNRDKLPHGSAALVSAHRLQQVMRPLPFRILFNAYRRFHLLVGRTTSVLSSETLVQLEDRLETADWQLMGQSWEPYRWITRALPLLAVIQAAFLFYEAVQPVMTGARQLQVLPAITLVSAVPVVQIVVVAIGLSLARGALERLEYFHLAKLDALYYDRLLSQVPLHSSDTVIVLNAIKEHFQQLETILERIESRLNS